MVRVISWVSFIFVGGSGAEATGAFSGFLVTVAAGLEGSVFRTTAGLDAAGVLEGAGSVLDLDGLVEPVAGLRTWR